MNRITTTLAAILTGLAVVFGVVTVGAPAAVAAQPTQYVTKAEFNQIGKGMPLWKVHRIFDVNGRQLLYDGGHAATQTRQYSGKSKASAAYVEYKQDNGTWKVTGKKAYWWGTWGSSAALARGHVIKAEFNQVRKGMPMKQVHRTFGATGSQFTYDSGYPGKNGYPATQTRGYRGKSETSSVWVDFQKNKGVWTVTGKSAYWG